MTTASEETPNEISTTGNGAVPPRSAPESSDERDVDEEMNEEAACAVAESESTTASDVSAEDVIPAPTTPSVTWNDVVKASAEVDAARVEREIVEDVLDVKLDESALADIARANAADDQEKTERQLKVDGLKTKLKDEKTAIDALTARMHDRNNAVLKGSQSRKAKWILETCFATNTATYRDPVTNRVVLDRALFPHERQVALPLVSTESTEKSKQLALGETGPDDDSAMTDPEALLKAAQTGELDPADAPLDNDGSSQELEDGDGDDEDEDGEDEESDQ